MPYLRHNSARSRRPLPPPHVPSRTGGRDPLSMPGSQHARPLLRCRPRPARVPAEKICSSASLASAPGFRSLPRSHESGILTRQTSRKSCSLDPARCASGFRGTAIRPNNSWCSDQGTTVPLQPLKPCPCLATFPRPHAAYDSSGSIPKTGIRRAGRTPQAWAASAAR